MEYEIRQWIEERLSTNLPEFNNLPACPFAKEALIKNKIVIQELDNQYESRLSIKEYFLAELENYSYHWPKGKEVIVLGCKPELISSDDLSDIVEIASEKFLTKRGFIALEDHPDVEEKVLDYKLNQGSYALILLQEAEKLQKAREILKKKQYYKNWTKDYLDDVVQSFPHTS